jgi:photosystem II stability/assembly factor-like uncharacterized protein
MRDQPKAIGEFKMRGNIGVIQAVVCVSVLTLFGVPQTFGQQYAPGLFSGLEWRLVGPYRGGRALSVTGVASEPLVYYFGGAASGVWKTVDGGQVWKPMFDKQPVSSIGAVAVVPSDPNIVYAGTGEADIRGDNSPGDGIYKSTNGGKTWANMGLHETQHIAKIVIDPHDPDIVFVAALGHVYGPNPERGVYRSTDAGKTWSRMLYKDDRTGAIDLTLDPVNSHVVYAAMWEGYRTPWRLNSGGPNSNLYKSTDDGVTWSLAGGVGWPKGPLGRIGVTISLSNPNRIYAMVEANEGGLYRSDDGGQSWSRVNSDDTLRQRAWYFSQVAADPKNPDVVYVVNMSLQRSVDGGKTFHPMPAPHGDHHDLWIDPNDPLRMINANDGGATVSNDGGETWTTEYNQPTAQFYHVAADNRFEYHLYGAQQDNTTVSIASRTQHGDISSEDWYPVGGGESGYDVPDPADPDIVYSGDKQRSTIVRFDKRTEQARDISEWPIATQGRAADELKYRFNWTEPIAISPFDPHEIYHAAQVLFKSTDDGNHWTVISPDLTRNDKSKQGISGGPIDHDNSTIEYYDVIFTVAESPVQRDLIWAGTDDGLVKLTRDGGHSWTNVTPKEMPEWGMVSLVDPSPQDPATAYIAVDRHKLDDLRPYVFKTHDYGKTWTMITNGIEPGAFVHAVREDPARKGLLYAGTETGMYVSFDDGSHWQSLQLNLPTVPVHDLAIKNDDLAIATHGRAFWILDDISALRQVKPDIADSQAFLYKPTVAYQVRQSGFGLPGSAPAGENPPDGAIIDYYLKTAAADQPVTLDILDSSGKLVQRFSTADRPKSAAAESPFGGRGQAPLMGNAGMNRFVWNLRYPSAPDLKGGPYPCQCGRLIGPLALPGSYTVQLTSVGQTLSAPLEIKLNPLVKVSEADLAKQFDLEQKIQDRLKDLDAAGNGILQLRSQIATMAARGALPQNITELDSKLATLEGSMFQIHLRSPEDDLDYPDQLREYFLGLTASVDSADTAPTPQSYELFNMLSKELDTQLAEWKSIVASDFPAELKTSER